ncbi:MAG: hypothetical protein K2J67_08945 [Lachnospiraceae bacterium]|nr:hypothetical protein [Lachnospiraceae bacterium]
MISKDILSLFQIDSEKASKGGSFLPEYVSATIKYEWDGVNKCYTDVPKSIVITAFFYALRKSKIDIVLPPNALTEKEIETLNSKADADEDISLDFKGLKIGLKLGFNGEIQIYATADGVEIA